MGGSLQGRLLLTYLALIALGLTGLIVWAGQRLQVAATEQAEHNLEIESFIVANALREPLEKWLKGKPWQGRSIDRLLESYARSANARLTVLDKKGRVLLSSDARIPLHIEDNHPEFIAARSGEEQHDIRLDEWSGEERLFVAAPIIEDGNKVIGFVQLSIPTNPLYAEIQKTWLSLMAAGGFILLGTAVVSTVLSRYIARPVKTLTAVTEEIAAGHLEQQVSPAGPSEIRRLGYAFNRMAERVQEMLARQQAFVADAAHELRSPLTSLRLRLEMLQTHGQTDSAMSQRYLRQMEQEVDHLRRLVDHLLALSSLDEGNRLPQTHLDLTPVLYDLMNDLSLIVQQASLRLETDIPYHLPPVMANAEQIRIIIRNLLDNAIKYTPANGQITVKAWSDNDMVKVSVADTGIGIPADALPHIFERFYRVDKSRSRQQGGAGLGLSLVRSLVEAHGGHLNVSSEPGRGSTFTVCLPIARAAPAPTAETSSKPEHAKPASDTMADRPARAAPSKLSRNSSS